MKTLKINSEDIRSISKTWQTQHQVWINDAYTTFCFWNQEHDINSLVKEMNQDEMFVEHFGKINSKEIIVDDEHTKNVLSRTYKSKLQGTPCKKNQLSKSDKWIVNGIFKNS